ncbi:hypothetical protein VM1G_07480 [Cytospora mali]|uniref:Uncharacterized protein n=1 Tax=Cytospora mali TaxID=578113 RepID=A0A194W5V6_CYTMA|nr:hypothetical protein VM1G_07480 [Valsa mali]
MKDGRLPIGHQGVPGTASSKSDIESVRASWLALLEHTKTYQKGVYAAFEHEARRHEDHGGDVAEKGEVKRQWLDDYKRAAGDSALTIPMAKAITISWDFMPPEIVKPFATISLHDLLILCHRLQLDWTEVNPMEGKLTAQDDYGNDVSSYSVRGLGLMIQFRHDTGRSEISRTLKPGIGRVKQYEPEDMMIPSSNADKLAFGIIPGDTRLGLDDVVVARNEDCLNYVFSLYDDVIDGQQKARGLLQRGFNGDITKSGIDQLVPLISPCMVLPNCKTIQARLPNRYCQIGVLEVMEGYVVFNNRITNLLDSKSLRPQRIEVLEIIMRHWREIKEEVGPWAPANVRNIADKAKLSTTMARVHESCTSWLENWSSEFLEKVDEAHKMVWARKTPYARPRDQRPVHDLMRFHLLRAFELREKARQRLQEKGHVDTYGLNWNESPIFSAMMHIQIDEVGELAREIVAHILGNQDTHNLQDQHGEQLDGLIESVASAWFMMIFRALVFNRSVTFIEPRRPGAGGRPYNLIPAQWLYSQIPVHIS